MFFPKRFYIIITTIVIMSLCFVVFASAQTGMNHESMKPASKMKNQAMSNSQTMMHNKMNQKTQYSDKAFLSEMIPHHQAAVEMAELVIKTGKDAQVKKWAEAVKAAQLPEIKQMTEWLNAMGGKDATAEKNMKASMHSMMAMPMSQNPDVNFVAMMIDHHAMAVEMSVPAVVYSTDDKVVQLANSIIKSQLQEIIEYKEWLKNYKN